MKGMLVKVYRNLNVGALSIICNEGRFKGKVVAHAKSAVVQNITFSVGLKARERIQLTRCKEVHAFVVGELVWADLTTVRYPECRVSSLKDKASKEQKRLVSNGIKANYNPYKAEYFYLESTGCEVKGASRALVLESGVYAEAFI